MAKRRLLGDRAINKAVDMGRAVRIIESANDILNMGKVCPYCGDDLFKTGEATLHMSTNSMRCKEVQKAGGSEAPDES